MAEQPLYGAFGDILTLDDAQDSTDADTEFKYGVYQLATQKPELEEGELQKKYGTGVMPIFKWVKLIQTGERTYDPNDFEDRAKLDEYKKLGAIEGLLTPEEIEKQMIADTTTAVASQVGKNIGQAFADDVESPFTQGIKSAFGFEELPSEIIQNPLELPNTSFDTLRLANAQLKGKGEYLFNPAVANEASAIASGNIDAYKSLKESGNFVNIGEKGGEKLFAFKGSGNTFNLKDGKGADVTVNIEGTNPNTGKAYQTFSDKTLPEESQGYWSRVKADASSKSTLYSSAGAGFTSFFADLILTKGEDPVKSAKKGLGTAAGTYVGMTLGGPIGAVVGASIGGSIVDRVICNELRRQGLMKTKDVTMDYKFTLEYLSPRHIKGYHFWAPKIVLGLRKGKMVKFWLHIAQHRSNEIQYIMGERQKPDYLGKLYRHIFEPICYIIGIFAQKRDISFLWKEKV